MGNSIINICLKKQVDDSYKIHIGAGIFKDTLINEIEKINPSKTVIITDSKIYNLYYKEMSDYLTKSNISIITFPEGEKNKNIDTVMALFSKLAELNLDRKSLVVALGGGVTGDISGFLSAVYMRGIPFIQVPTSLLAMVDSSVGGKTGIDSKEGKNLIGAFYQPKAVIIDIDWLKTLEEEQFINGMAEVIKYGIIQDRDFFSFLEDYKKEIDARDSETLIKMIKRCCELKAEVVEKDEKENGLRQILNLGHTIGHAIENSSGFKIPHGFAVAMGMVSSANISVKRGVMAQEEAKRINDLIQSYGLMKYTSEVNSLNEEDLLNSAMMDKKNKGEIIYFVMSDKIGQVFRENGNVSVTLEKDEMIKAIYQLSIE